MAAILANASLAAMDSADGSSAPAVAPLLEELEASTRRAAQLYGHIRLFDDPVRPDTAQRSIGQGFGRD